jgi:hypothetical protein
LIASLTTFLQNESLRYGISLAVEQLPESTVAFVTTKNVGTSNKLTARSVEVSQQMKHGFIAFLDKDEVFVQYEHFKPYLDESYGKALPTCIPWWNMQHITSRS